MNTFAATINSAWETLEICDRQARKDYHRVHTAVTSQEAIAFYGRVWVFCLYTAATVVVLSQLTVKAGHKCRAWADAYVEASLKTEEVAIAAEPADNEGLGAKLNQLFQEAEDTFFDYGLEDPQPRNAIAPVVGSLKSSKGKRDRSQKNAA